MSESFYCSPYFPPHIGVIQWSITPNGYEKLDLYTRRNSLCWCILYKHWPDTREPITQDVELWNKWSRLHVITTEYRTRVHYIHTYHLLCNALIRVIYSIVSGQYSYTIILAFIFLYLEMWWLKCLSIYEDECYTMRCSMRLYTVLFKVNILLSCFIFVYLWSFSVCIHTVFITYTI